jgi:hypothetical protein
MLWYIVVWLKFAGALKVFLFVGCVNIFKIMRVYI